MPKRRVSSQKIEQELGLSEGWIVRRTGIENRPVVAEGEATSDLSLHAAQQALAEASVAPGEIGLLLLATSTPDHLLPPTAPYLADQLGMAGTGAVDVTGACAGFLYALAMGHSFCQLHQAPILVVGANVLSSRINPEDKATAALFSDAAGAVVLTPTTSGAGTFEGFHLGSKGSKHDNIYIPAGGSRQPMSKEAVANQEHLIHMKRGKAVFRGAVEAMVRSGETAMEAAGCTSKTIDWWIPHQANQRITDKAGKQMDIPPERTVSIIREYGNSSAATIPLGLSLAVDQDKVKPGDRLLLTAVGAGMIEAGAVLTW